MLWPHTFICSQNTQSYKIKGKIKNYIYLFTLASCHMYGGQRAAFAGVFFFFSFTLYVSLTELMLSDLAAITAIH